MYDAIPAGKKQIIDKETGQPKLVDLSNESVEDLQIILSEKEATIEELEKENKELKEKLGLPTEDKGKSKQKK